MNAHSQTTLSAAAPAHRPVVLVVDDQPANIQTLYQMLKADYEVCMAVGGLEALNF
jgi:CheY-like chemotaxis protein